MRINIYCDSDGVIADWRGYVLSLPQFEGWKIDDLNKSPYREALLRDLYEEDPHLFYKLRRIQGSHALLKKLTELNDSFGSHQYRVAILTAIGEEHPDYNQAAAGKREYFHYKHKCTLPVICVRRSEDKASAVEGLRSEGDYRILIDDFQKNCNQWEAAHPHNIAIKVDDDETSINSDYDGQALVDKLMSTISKILTSNAR